MKNSSVQKTFSSKLYRNRAKRWNSIDFRIKCRQNQKKLFSFIRAILIHHTDVDIAENIEWKWRFDWIVFFLNSNEIELN